MQHCDSKCSFCATEFWNWVKSREAQMRVPRKSKGEKTPFSEAAASSVKA